MNTINVFIAIIIVINSLIAIKIHGTNNGDEILKDIDNNEYRVVAIGNQIWMGLNLNVSRFNNGDSITNAKADSEWDELSRQGKPAWSYYNNNSEYAKKYGKLYNWHAVADSRGLCPDGWQVPSDEDWTELTEHLGRNAGGKMKASDTLYWKAPNVNATNESRFDGLPGGMRRFGASFHHMGLLGFWWSSTEISSGFAWRQRLNYKSGNANRFNGYKLNGFSVRCIKVESTELY